MALERIIHSPYLGLAAMLFSGCVLNMDPSDLKGADGGYSKRRAPYAYPSSPDDLALVAGSSAVDWIPGSDGSPIFRDGGYPLDAGAPDAANEKDDGGQPTLQDGSSYHFDAGAADASITLDGSYHFDASTPDASSSIPDGGYDGSSYHFDAGTPDASITLDASYGGDAGTPNPDGSTDACVIQSYFLDNDEDTYGDSAHPLEACVKPVNYVDNDIDCDDHSAQIYPFAPEICDERDNDCDGDTDEALAELIDDFNREDHLTSLGNNILGYPWTNYGSLGNWHLQENKAVVSWRGGYGDNPSVSSYIGHRDTFNYLFHFKLSNVNSVGGYALAASINSSGGSPGGNMDGLVLRMVFNSTTSHHLFSEGTPLGTFNKALQADTTYIMRFKLTTPELLLKIWPEQEPEPDLYNLTLPHTNSSPEKGFIGFTGDLDTGEELTITIDDIVDECIP